MINYWPASTIYLTDSKLIVFLNLSCLHEDWIAKSILILHNADKNQADGIFRKP